MARCVQLDNAPEHWHVHGHLLQLCGREDEGREALLRAVQGYQQRFDELWFRAAPRGTWASWTSGGGRP